MMTTSGPQGTRPKNTSARRAADREIGPMRRIGTVGTHSKAVGVEPGGPKLQCGSLSHVPGQQPEHHPCLLLQAIQ